MHMTLCNLALPAALLHFLLLPIKSFHIGHTGLSVQQTCQMSAWNSTIALSFPLLGIFLLIYFFPLIIRMKALG